MEQDTERILESFRGRRALAALPPRLKAWERAREAVTGGFDIQKAKLAYAQWKLVKLARAGVERGADPELLELRIADFKAKLEDFLS